MQRTSGLNSKSIYGDGRLGRERPCADKDQSRSGGARDGTAVSAGRAALAQRQGAAMDHHGTGVDETHIDASVHVGHHLSFVGKQWNAVAASRYLSGVDKLPRPPIVDVGA